MNGTRERPGGEEEEEKGDHRSSSFSFLGVLGALSLALPLGMQVTEICCGKARGWENIGRRGLKSY